MIQWHIWLKIGLKVERTSDIWPFRAFTAPYSQMLRSFIDSNAGKLVVAQAFSQLIMLASLPVITRTFAPGEVGLWSVLQSVAGFVWAYSVLRADLSVVQATDAAAAQKVYAAGSVSQLLFSLPLFPILWWLFPQQFDHWWAFFWVWVYVTGFNQNLLFQAVLLRGGAWNALSFVRITAALLTFPFAVVSGWLVPCLLAGVWLPMVWSKSVFPPFSLWRWESVRWYVQHFRKNALFGTLHTTFEALAAQMLIVLTGAYLSPFHAAAFFLAMRICSAPVSLLSGSVGQYNLRLFQREMEVGRFSVWHPVRHWLRWLPLSVLYYGFVWYWGERGAVWLFGAEWALAGQMAVWLILPFSLTFLTSPTSNAFAVIGRQEYMLMLSSGTLARFFITWAAVDYTRDPLIMAAVYAITGLLYTFAFNGVLLWAIHKTCTSS